MQNTTEVKTLAIDKIALLIEITVCKIKPDINIRKVSFIQ